MVDDAKVSGLELSREWVSSDTQTRKILFRLADNNTIESTLMLFRNPGTGKERRTVCVSSQVGCTVGCPFCATGQQGFVRNLSAGEILGQIRYFIQHFGADTAIPVKGKTPKWLTNVVFMGMGEPLANYENIRASIAELNSPKGLGLGFHQVTLSTSGLVPQIQQITGEGLYFELAVSLHAANDKLRDQLVPINKKYPLHQLISGCKEYAVKSKRIVFIEYALFNGVNDSIQQADDLIALLTGLPCSINLILGNPVPAGEFQPSSRETALVFQKKLIAAGIRTMLRVSRGSDIEAGCGQLRSRNIK
jgi:23S rRNA (adenine2503-C2)-methyltransferase